MCRTFPLPPPFSHSHFKLLGISPKQFSGGLASLPVILGQEFSKLKPNGTILGAYMATFSDTWGTMQVQVIELGALRMQSKHGIYLFSLFTSLVT